MIIPSIDLMGGQAVQLIGGKEKALDAGDPRPLAEHFRLAGEIAVIDLDAALGIGSNESTIRDLLRIAPCRVGGGIRDVETARKWLDAGATRVILGTKAEREILGRLPKERVIAALDAEHGEIVVEGWTAKTGRSVLERMKDLKDWVGGFLVTFIEREGRLQGTNIDQVSKIVQTAGDARVTIAGGVTTADDIRELDRLHADAQVGMALYSGKLDLADAIAAPLSSDRPDGLWPTVVVDDRGIALGLVWSNPESLREAVRLHRGVYHSRSRGLWKKGETSGNIQHLFRVDLDCDRDSLRFVVSQAGEGFCHLNTYTCWGHSWGLSGLAHTIRRRLISAPAGSYTRRLFEDEKLLREKLIEEAKELADSSSSDQAIAETADLLYFALVAMTRRGARLEEVERELDDRSLRITRRPGDAKIDRREDP